MAKLVLDSSVLIAVAKKHVTFDEILNPADDYFLPEVVIAEFLTGVELAKSETIKSYELTILEAFEAASEVIPFDRKQARAWALLSAASIRAGKARSSFDLAIASAAFVLEAQVLTADRAAQFEQLPGVSAQYF